MPRDIRGKPVLPPSAEKSGMSHMLRTKEDKKGENIIGRDSGPDYPYGLRLHIDHDGMKKLGMKELPEVGHEVHIRAKAHVSSASSEKQEGQEDHHRLELQITHLGIAHKADGFKAEDQGGSGKIKA